MRPCNTEDTARPPAGAKNTFNHEEHEGHEEGYRRIRVWPKVKTLHVLHALHGGLPVFQLPVPKLLMAFGDSILINSKKLQVPTLAPFAEDLSQKMAGSFAMAAGRFPIATVSRPQMSGIIRVLDPSAFLPEHRRRTFFPLRPCRHRRCRSSWTGHWIGLCPQARLAG